MPEEFSPVSPTPPTPPTPLVPTSHVANTLPARRINPALIAGLILLLALAGYLGWLLFLQTPPAATPTNEATPSARTATTSATPSAIPSTTPIAISASLKENIAAAISSKNTAALEGYMAASVNSVIAASGKGGPVTPAQAVTDLDYLSAGTSPWNFNLSAATLTGFKNGAYGSYFGNGTYVGESTNHYVVSFGINSAGKISTIFMAQNASLLN